MWRERTHGGAGHESPGASSRWRNLLIYLAGIALLALVGQGARALWEPDEGRYVAVAVQMLHSGDWMTPHLNYELPHFTKPPLTYWAIAASIKLFGQTEFAARLPNALAFILLGLIVLRLASLLAPEHAYTAGIVWATSLFPFVAANIVTTDTMLAAGEAAAVLAFVAHWKTGRQGFLVAMWAAFGLAFLVKGPPALIPLAGIVLFLLVVRPDPMPRLWSTAGVLLFAAIGFGWYAAAISSRHDLLPYLLGNEVVDRATTSAHGRNSGMFGWLKAYLPVALLGMLPWSAVLLRKPAGGAQRDSDERFLWFWLLVPLAIFILVPSRLPLYILPLSVPAALLIARRLPDGFLAQPRRRVLLVAWAVLLIALKVGASYYPSPRDAKRVASWIRESLHGAPPEVHFIGAKPEFGLTFYLDSDVEEVELGNRVDPTPAYVPISETLAAELEEDPAGSAYVVARPLTRRFEGELRAHGYKADAVATSGSFVLYGHVVPES